MASCLKTPSNNSTGVNDHPGGASQQQQSSHRGDDDYHMTDESAKNFNPKLCSITFNLDTSAVSNGGDCATTPSSGTTTITSGANGNLRPLSPAAPALQIDCESAKVFDELTANSRNFRPPPLICEQGPSAPSSPTSPGGRRKPNSLQVDALQRLDLLSPNYVPTMDFNKLSPLSPSYPTSDLGSSPRSSISMTQSGLGPQWTCFRDFKKSSSDYDGDSDICSKDLLSPGALLSPAPFSPFSDCYGSETPYSQRSPNMSPMPTRHAMLHFSFDQVRSRSSMSNRGDEGANLLMPTTSLDFDSRERSRSEGEMLKDSELEADIINHSTVSVPLTSSRLPTSSSYRKRILQNAKSCHESASKHFHESYDSVTTDASLRRNVSMDQDDLMNASVSTQVSRQPTIEEPPPDPTLAELINAGDLPQERQAQLEDWLKQQVAALEILRNAMVPMQQGPGNLLQVPNQPAMNPVFLQPPQLPQTTDMQSIANFLAAASTSAAQQRQQFAWKRSRSETDVSNVQPLTPTGPAATTEQSFICEHCGQAFAMHDRLAKHIASRHRDRSASVNDENSKTHKCTLCPKSFGRSDMLTRHMRLHTGVKPYNCLICGQVFSRSDHLSTHQRTHTGEKPYRCPHCSYSASRRDMITRHMRTHLRPDGTIGDLPINIGTLSLNSRSPLLTPEPSLSAASSPQYPSSPVPGLFANPGQPQFPFSTPSDDANALAAANAATFTTMYNNAQQQMKLAQMNKSSSDYLCRSMSDLSSLLVPSASASDFAGVFGNSLSGTTPSNSTSLDMSSAVAAALAQKMPSPFPPQPPPPANASAMLNAQVAAAQLFLQQQAQQQQQQSQVNVMGGLSPSVSMPSNLVSSFMGAAGDSTLRPPQLSPNPSSGGGGAMLARQSSIGGFGFS